MGKKTIRAGGKFTGSHTTVVPAAGEIADIAAGCRVVTKIAIGFIKAGLRPTQGRRALKISPQGAGLLLSVRDNTSHQELHVYATDVEEAKRCIRVGAEEIGIQVTFA